MFSKQFRLPATTVLQDPRHTQTGYFSLKVSKNSLHTNRYGFVVGKQVDKRATVRNSMKRRVRAYLENEHEHLAQGFDLLFIIKKPALELSTENLWKTIKKSLQEVNLL